MSMQIIDVGVQTVECAWDLCSSVSIASYLYRSVIGSHFFFKDKNSRAFMSFFSLIMKEEKKACSIDLHDVGDHLVYSSVNADMWKKNCSSFVYSSVLWWIFQIVQWDDYIFPINIIDVNRLWKLLIFAYLILFSWLNQSFIRFQGLFACVFFFLSYIFINNDEWKKEGEEKSFFTWTLHSSIRLIKEINLKGYYG